MMDFRSCHLYQTMTENNEPRYLLTTMTVFELAYCPSNLSLEKILDTLDAEN